MVDSRFDAGYFVTVRIGKHEFKGMLYYPPPEHTQVALPSPAWHVQDIVQQTAFLQTKALLMYRVF